MWSRLRARFCDVDGPIICVVLAVFLTLPLVGNNSVLSALFVWGVGVMEGGIYDRGLAGAVQARNRVVPVAAISGDTVRVVAFRGQPLTNGPVSRDLWVALPGELKAACAKRPEAGRALQQILGLKPENVENWSVYEMSVASRNLFRPCVSGPDIRTDLCLPSPRPAQTPAQNQAAPQPQAQLVSTQSTPAAVPQGEKHAAFMMNLLWEGYGPRGYPFTGMGWTYDWGVDSADHVGVSEFILMASSPITLEKVSSAAEFCSSSR